MLARFPTRLMYRLARQPGHSPALGHLNAQDDQDRHMLYQFLTLVKGFFDLIAMQTMIRKLAVQRLARSLNLPLGILKILEGLSE